MIQPWLKVGDFKLAHNEVNRGAVEGESSPHELKVLRLCQEWMSGRATWTFQTSGSTGTPKTITFTRAQLEASARLSEKALHLQAGQTSLICLDPAFIAGAMMVIRSLVTGMNMIAKTPSANPLAGIHEPIDFAALVPYQVSRVMDEDPSLLSGVGTIIIGGAPLSPDVSGKLIQHPGSIYATYGMTETITHVALQKLNEPGRQDYFELLPGIEIRTDESGCLSLYVPHISGDWITTHDVVALLAKNKFRWLGRFDRVINSGGVKVQPEKVEQVIEYIFGQLRIDRRFFVTGLPDPKLGERVALVVEGPVPDSTQEDQFRKLMSEKLGAFEIPRSIHYVSRFKETETQKIDRVKTLQQVIPA